MAVLASATRSARFSGSHAHKDHNKKAAGVRNATMMTTSKNFHPSTTKNTLLSLPSDSPTIQAALKRISSHPSLTPFRRRVYRTLLSVPPGRWTTYGALSTHLLSSARAIGNAMRTNPFAPDVPCHRVLATDRTIGGYKGAWGNGGSYATEKTKLLVGEGVLFDGKGKAGGEVFTQFVDMGNFLEQ